MRTSIRVGSCILGSTLAFGGNALAYDDFDDPKLGPAHEVLGPAWQVSTWSNRYPFQCTFSASNVTKPDKALKLRFDGNGSVASQTCAEAKTTQSFQYGEFVVRMKPVRASGTISSFFLYTGRAGTRTHYEIDIEFIPGKDLLEHSDPNYYPPGAMHTNFWVKGQEKPKPVNLSQLFDIQANAFVKDPSGRNISIDPYASFRSYKIVWTPKSLSWHVDVSAEFGQVEPKWIKVREETVSISAKMPVMMNTWIFDSSQNTWGGRFAVPDTYFSPSQTIREGAAEYDFVRINKLPATQ